MIAGFELFGSPHFDCLIHKIQLAVNDGIEHRTKSVQTIRDIIHASREIVGHYKCNVNFRNGLKTQQSTLGMAQNVLIQDVPTRWNSTFNLLERIYEQRRPLLLVAEDFKLKLPDFALVSEVCEVLKPFESFTKQLSKRTENIGTAITIYRCLQSFLKVSESDSIHIAQLKNVLDHGLRIRMEQHTSKKFLVLATLLDPRYKNNRSIFSAIERKQNELLLTMEVEMLLNPSRRNSDSEIPVQPIIGQNTSTNLLASFLDTTVQEPQLNANELVQIDLAKNETARYLKADLVPLESDPLLFWQNSMIFPNLKRLARIYLSPPPSTVESERTFSHLGQIYKPNRFSLSSEHAKQQLFLHFNYDMDVE